MRISIPLLILALFIAVPVSAEQVINLPKPQVEHSAPLAKVLGARRSVRQFQMRELNLGDVSQLTWATQGITNARGYRTAPSAGALFPLELYLVVGKVDSLKPGIYHYLPASHAVEYMVEGDRRKQLSQAALGQQAIRQAPIVFVIAGAKERSARKYGDRAQRYVWIEAGHAGQNLLLQATALGLGSVVIGAFHDKMVQQVLELEDSLAPITLIPAGWSEVSAR